MKKIPIALCIIYIVLLLYLPSAGREGAITGIIICGNVLIPSLFPFTVCALYLMKSDLLSSLGGRGRLILVFFLSLLGGYPVGARLVSELYRRGDIENRYAARMLYCCVNAGPAFIVIAVGTGILNSRSLGYILLSAHILASIIIAALIIPFIKVKKTFKNKNQEGLNSPFVSSVGDAAAAMLSICAFVIFFSSLNENLSFLSYKYPFWKDIASLIEVTGGVSRQKSIYKIAFLLGFAGFSVWFQIFVSLKDIELRMLHFIFARIIHGSLSVIITYILVLVIKPQIPTLSAGSYAAKAVYSTPALSIALLIMTILLIISIFGKTRGRKLREDLI